MVKEDGFEIDERGEIGEGAEEGVVFETQHSELVEAAEGGGGDCAPEAEALNDVANNTALGAFDASPLAVVEAFVCCVEELVIQVCLGLECQQCDSVGRKRCHRISVAADANSGGREA